MGPNYKLQKLRSCNNCTFAQHEDWGIVCLRNPASHKNDAREVEHNGICDDYILWAVGVNICRELRINTDVKIAPNGEQPTLQNIPHYWTSEVITIIETK